MQRNVVLTSALLVVAIAQLPADEKKEPSTKSISGTTKMAAETYKIQHAFAFEIKRSGKTNTVIYLTEEAIDQDKLKENLKKKGSDDGFFLFKPQIKLRFDENGKLDYVFLYADGASINSSGSKNMVAEVTIKDGVLSGTAKMNKPEKFFDKEYTFDAKFEAKIVKP